MRLFADNKSAKLQRKLQKEEQLLFEQEQAKKRAQIVQDEKLAKELQAQENRPRGESSPDQASPPPLPARPPKPLAYHPEYLPRQQSDPSPTTPTTHNTMPFSRARTTSTPTVVDTSTFPPRSPARTSPTGPQPASGRSSPPLYPPTITSSPPTLPTSNPAYQNISNIPPKPSASAPPTYPRRDPVMFIVPTPHSNTAALPPAPRPEPKQLPPVVNTNVHYSSSAPQNSYINEPYNEYHEIPPSQQEYFQYQPSPQVNQPHPQHQLQEHNHQNYTPSSYSPVYPSQQEWAQNQSNSNQPEWTQNKSSPNEHEWTQSQSKQYIAQPKTEPSEWTQRAQQETKSQYPAAKPDDIREKQLTGTERRPSKIRTIATNFNNSDSDSDDYSDFVVRVGPLDHKRMVEEKSSAYTDKMESDIQAHSDIPSKVQQAKPIDLVDPFADTNAIEWDTESQGPNTTDGAYSPHSSESLPLTDQDGLYPSGTNELRTTLATPANDIQRPESAANFRQMQARLNALLNGNHDQSKTIQESPLESSKVENEDEEVQPEEKVELADEVTVAVANTPAQFHSPLHTRSKSSPEEQIFPVTRTPQQYSRITQPPKLARPPIPKTPKPVHIRSTSISGPATPSIDPRRNTIAEPPLYPPTITPSLPPAMLPSGDVLAGIPHNEFGFYRVDTPAPDSHGLVHKALPQPPPNLPKGKSENRHITCKLPKHITAGHRVWIAIKPSDTGKTLAQRIHVVATLRTMKITGIKTAAGRQVPLDNTPVFATWQEIENFKDGELWTFETGGEPENFLIQGGKDWFKQIISNMRE